jgi:hypothetical protein
MAVHLLTELRRARRRGLFEGILGMTRFRLHLLAALAVAGYFVSAPAFAQVSGCQEGQKIIAERRSLSEQFAKLTQGGKKIDARSACSLFTKLATNGEVGQKWMTENKDWCQIPDQALQELAQAHKQVTKVKGDACQAAAKMAEMEKRAKQQAQQAQQGGMAGKMGGGLTGTLSVPKGAL